MNPNPLPPPIEHRFKPGNPGGSSPRGKRISTWMAEFGELPPEKWPDPKKKKLSANARIALVRLKKALDSDKLGLANSEYVEPRQRPMSEEGEARTPMIQQIAAAILALKAAGVEVRRTIEVENVVPAPQAIESDHDEAAQERRFRRSLS